eukprot:Phypoly_transcript_09482.p1 GENE.Phypoly_transcript_09482~~Phypoly_transcript_09482.p1  ORF type:complete len:397 (+),score=44.91 Phypoly_transcript_09482:157-1347(+)
MHCYTNILFRTTIKFRTSLRNTILDVLLERGWKETDSDTDWDFNWADKEWIREVYDAVHFKDHQRLNHYRNFYEIARKDLLIKNLKRTRKALEREDKVEEALKYDFFPATFNLPSEYSLFLEEFKKAPGAFWIMKPIAKSQGKGIFLFNKLSQISEWKKWKTDSNGQSQQNNSQAEAYIVQRYIENPYLVGGKKFDMRIYCLVLSYNPLTVYLYRSGFGRFSHHRFSISSKDMSNNFIHLTNVAVQKTSDSYNASTGCKWELRNLRLFLMSRHGVEATEKAFLDIQNIMLLALQSVQKVMIQDKHCFEMYGYDILIDDELKPWILEVNSSPSLSAENPADYQLKNCLLHDLLDIIDVEKKNEGGLGEQMGGFDLIYANGKAKNVSYLGCFNAHLGR